MKHRTKRAWYYGKETPPIGTEFDYHNNGVVEHVKLVEPRSYELRGADKRPAILCDVEVLSTTPKPDNVTVFSRQRKHGK